MILLITLFCIVFIVLSVISMDRISKSVNRHNKDNTAKDPATRWGSPYEKNNSVKVEHKLQANIAEISVDRVLRQLEEGRYFVFKDLIIPSSSKSVSLTQIDHVLVSRMGIFCIETKSHNGNIYGFTRNEHWKQYLGSGGEPFSLYSPFRQNNHHVSSLEKLLHGKLRAPVHSYIAFPNARKVMVDSKVEDMSPSGVLSKIINHSKAVYDQSEVEIIAKILAHAGTFREELRGRHADEVRAYIDAKVSGTFKFS